MLIFRALAALLLPPMQKKKKADMGLLLGYCPFYSPAQLTSCLLHTLKTLKTVLGNAANLAMSCTDVPSWRSLTCSDKKQRKMS